MTTRFTARPGQRHGVGPLPTGYDATGGPSDLTIPSCGVEDVDVALFTLFDKEVAPEVGGHGSVPIAKVPVVFAAGEKWALLKRGRPLRDRNNTLILPLITVMRTDLNQTLSDDVVGRGINQQTGELVIRRKLDKSDRGYQALINRLYLNNQRNLAVKPGDPGVPGQLRTERDVGSTSSTKTVRDGALLTPDLTNNVYETIVVPSPQFYTAKYQVTIWTQYTQHSNQVLEKIYSTLLPQAQSWKLETQKGYWFVARIEDGSLAMETNFDDMSTSERYIKHTFNVIVPAYFFASSAPGVPVPIRRYVSSPSVTFEVPEELPGENDSEYVLGSDDPTLPLDTARNNRLDQRTPGWRQQKIYPVLPEGTLIDPTDPRLSEDPALSSLPRGYSVKVKNTTSKGETAYSGAALDTLDIVVVK